MSAHAPYDERVARLPLAVGLASLPVIVALTAATPSPYSSFEEWAWISGTFVAVVHALLVGWLARRPATRSRAGVIAAGVMAVWALPLAMVTVHALQAPPIAVGRPAFCGGTGPITLLGLSPIFLLALLVGLGVALLLRWRGLDRALGVVAHAAMVVVPLWTLVAWSAARQPARAYLASIPVIAELTPGERAQLQEYTLRYERNVAPQDEGTSPRCTIEGLDAPFELFTQRLCPPVRVRFDPAGGLGLVEERTVGAAQPFRPLFAFRSSEGSVRSLDASELGGLAGPPRWYFIAALLSAALGASVLLLARAGRRARGTATELDAVHDGEGRCALDGAEVLVPAAARLPLGPIVLVDTTRTEPGYRDSARAFAAAYAGTVAAKRLRDRDLAASLEALALALALLGATPLLLANALGLR